MRIRNLLTGLFAFIAFGAQAAELPKTEPVNGYYDAKNDWFVFEWVNPEDGKMQAIYDSSNKIKPVAHAAVSFNQSSGVFTYSFRFENQTGALQLLSDIFVDHKAPISEASAPSLQSEWYMGEYRNLGVWQWAKTRGTLHGIPAGQAVSGLAFKSKGLPTIVNIEFAGRRRVHISSPSPDDDTEEVLQSYNRIYDKLEAQYPEKFVDTIKQKTVGPIAPPAKFDAAGFIQNLNTLVKQSRAQNWIDNDGIANSLLSKLNTAASKVASDSKTAKNSLGAFLSDAQAQNGKHLSSEAYALLYFNGKYLADHM